MVITVIDPSLITRVVISCAFTRYGMVRQLVEGNRELKALHVPGALVLTYIPVFEKNATLLKKIILLKDTKSNESLL